MRRVISQSAVVIAASLVILMASVVLAFNNHNSHGAEIVFGKTDLAAAPQVVATTEPSLTAVGEPDATEPVIPAPRVAFNASGNGAPSDYRGSVSVPKDLKFFLIVGSDARPGQDVTRSRADSIHIAAIDPQNRQGTILGFPRDSYVDIPGHGRNKINASMVYGGPDLLVQTLRNLTGMPIEYWCVASFNGIQKMTNTLGGVDVDVPYDINDSYSGAHFKKGWHHMNGEQVLSFSRARHGVPGGDFGRSENQARVIKHALEKMRHETKDETGIHHWVNVLYQWAHMEMSMKDALSLGKLARQIVPTDLKNVVAPGSAQMVGGSSVVILSQDAYKLFKDVRADAQADGNETRGAPRPMPTAKPTPKPKPTHKPGAKPTPKPKPSGGGLPLPLPPR